MEPSFQRIHSSVTNSPPDTGTPQRVHRVPATATPLRRIPSDAAIYSTRMQQETSVTSRHLSHHQSIPTHDINQKIRKRLAGHQMMPEMVDTLLRWTKRSAYPSYSATQPSQRRRAIQKSEITCRIQRLKAAQKKMIPKGAILAINRNG